MKKNLITGILIGANLVLAAFLLMGHSSSPMENTPKAEVAPVQEGFIGEIKLFGGNFAPRGWAFCDGQLLSIAQNNALFSILGTTYGGDGRTNFALPDLRGRVAIHPGQGPGLSSYRLGQKGGIESVTLTTAQLPVHNHPIQASTGKSNASTPAGNIMANAVGVPGLYSSKSADTSMKPTGNTGGGRPVDNVQPYQALNYIICLQGIYPSRN